MKFSQNIINYVSYNNMFTIVGSGFGLCGLFEDCPYEMFETYLSKMQFPVIVFSKQQKILTYLRDDDDEDDYSFHSYYGKEHYGEAYIRCGNGMNYKMLMFNDINRIYKINHTKTEYGTDEPNSKIFYGININEISLSNAKILIFINAIHDDNSIVTTLNYDIINYILSFFGPFTKKFVY